jgi:aminoglycoside 3-N-acetyltransferase
MNIEYLETNIRDSLIKLGVKSGDCLFVHSGLKSLGKFIPKNNVHALEALLNLFLDAVGDDGTVIVPTFNFAFCSGAVYDRNETPCDHMGAFSEYVRLHKSSYRSLHPFQSVAAIGRNAIKISGSLGFSGFSKGSSFDVLLQLNCKILFYGVNFVETFVHIAEERAKVPYRFWKTFTGDIIDGETKKTIDINFYARRFDLEPEPRVDVEKINRYLREKKIISSTNLGIGEVSICNGNEMVNDLTDKFVAEPTFPLIN